MFRAPSPKTLPIPFSDAMYCSSDMLKWKDIFPAYFTKAKFFSVNIVWYGSENYTNHIGWPRYFFEYLGCIYHREIWCCLGLSQVPQNNAFINHTKK